MRRAARTAVTTVVALVAMLAAASCTVVNGVRDAQTELASAGFADARVTLARNTGSAIVLDVRYRTDAGGTQELAAEQLRAAEIIWRAAPLRFDRVRVRATNEPASCAGDCRAEFTRTQLEEQFGVRDASLDRDVMGQLAATGAAVLAGLALLVVLAVRSRAAKRRPGEPLRGPSDVTRPPPPPEKQTVPSPYADPYAYRGPLVPPPPAEPQSWQDPPSAAPAPEPTYDIWERPPS